MPLQAYMATPKQTKSELQVYRFSCLNKKTKNFFEQKPLQAYMPMLKGKNGKAFTGNTCLHGKQIKLMQGVEGERLETKCGR